MSIRPSTIYHRWSSHSNTHWAWHGEQTQSPLYIQVKRGTHRMLSEVRRPLDTFSQEWLAMEVEDAVHRPICTEHLLARRAMLMNHFPSLCLHISLSPSRARHMEGRVPDCGRESSASAKRQCKSDKRSAGNLQLSSRTSTQSVYMNPLLLASKSNNSHPTLTGKLLLTLSGPSLVQSPSICRLAFSACWWFQEQFLIEAYQGGKRMTLTFSILSTQHQEMLKFSKVTKPPSQTRPEQEWEHIHTYIHTHSHRQQTLDK